jgi:hypothetical protein
VVVAVRQGLAPRLGLVPGWVQVQQRPAQVPQHLVQVPVLAQEPALQRRDVEQVFHGSGVGAAWTDHHPAGGPVVGLPAVPAPALSQALVIPAEQVQPLAQVPVLQRQARVLADASAQGPVRQLEEQPLVPVMAQPQAAQVLVPVAEVVPQRLAAAVLAPAQVRPQVVRVPVLVVALRSARQALHQAQPARPLRPPVRQKCHHRLPGHQPVPAALPAIAGARLQR